MDEAEASQQSIDTEQHARDERAWDAARDEEDLRARAEQVKHMRVWEAIRPLPTSNPNPSSNPRVLGGSEGANLTGIHG